MAVIHARVAAVPAAIGLLVLAATPGLTAPVGGTGAAGLIIYGSHFARDLSGFSIQWTGSGKLGIALDPTRRGPSGEPSLRTDVPELSTGTVGVGIKVGAWRLWRIELWGATEAAEGSVSVALQCWGTGGKQVDWIQVGGLPEGDTLRPIRAAVEIPASCTHLNLLVLHEKMRGQSWIADVSVRELHLTPQMEADMRPAGPTRWGATQYLRPKDPTLRDTGAKLLVAAGVTHTRTAIDWRDAEPERGHYDFSSLDTQLAELAHYGAKADVVFIQGTPTWASGKTWKKDLPPDKVAQPWSAKRAFFPPRDWGDWRRFVTALVTHFRGRVPCWEIINEPDLWSEGFCGTYDDYKHYLQIAYEAAHKADPKCKVLLGAFVFGEWLPRLLSEGMQRYFDGVCVHPYHSLPAGSVSRARAAQLQLILANAPKPLYVTEVGYQSGGWKEGPAVMANEQEKATAGAEALRGLAKLANFVCWYTAIEPGNMYGLLRDDGDRLLPMPMYYAYGQLTGRLVPGKAPVKAKVALPAGPVARGREDMVRLTVSNTSAKTQAVKVWPVGFVTNLGLDLAAVRRLDWTGKLAPGASRTIEVRVKPTTAAKGDYPVGVAVVDAGGNALALGELKVAGR